jgi:hypothetical protein
MNFQVWFSMPLEQYLFQKRHRMCLSHPRADVVNLLNLRYTGQDPGSKEDLCVLTVV